VGNFSLYLRFRACFSTLERKSYDPPEHVAAVAESFLGCHCRHCLSEQTIGCVCCNDVMMRQIVYNQCEIITAQDDGRDEFIYQLFR
jgi:hypothetical protein